MSSTIGAGELFLRGPKKKAYRLVWKANDKDRRRALPAGLYTITGYRLSRKDRQGKEWFLSATSHGHKKIQVSAGKPTRVEIDSRIHLSTSASARTGKLRGNMMISGDGAGGRGGNILIPTRRIGLSIYRSGKRISIPYRVLDRDKAELASGIMKYG